jgi:prepilin-type N-terminal cleavage/methylation domain-containing protein
VTRASLRRLARDERGFTLIELIVSAAVLSILAAAFGFVLSATVTHSAATQDAQVVQQEARAAVERFASDLRQAYTGDDAAYPIEVVNGTTVRFLSPNRTVPFRLRRITYRVNAGVLERQQAISTDTDGAPWNFGTAGAWTRLVAGVTTASPFSFEDADGDPTSNPLEVRTVRVQLTVRTKGKRTSKYGTTVTVRSDAT